jgi:alkaline phosphatase D
MLFVPALLSLATAVTADWSGNINYGSPSSVHDLAISIPKVKKRQEGAQYMNASQISFTHGVASGDPYANSVILWVSSLKKSVIGQAINIAVDSG